MHWLITDKGDPEARKLVDGEVEGLDGKPHYSRVTPGSPQFTRNGQNLVFIHPSNLAVWVTFRPTPGKAKRTDNLDAWECALFRNETHLLGADGVVKSSILIREAVLLSYSLWLPSPTDGFITYIKPECVKTEVPGYCYRRAGWKHWGYAADGKPRLKAPKKPDAIPHWSMWRFKRGRGGRLRQELMGNTYIETGFDLSDLKQESFCVECAQPEQECLCVKL